MATELNSGFRRASGAPRRKRRGAWGPRERRRWGVRRGEAPRSITEAFMSDISRREVFKKTAADTAVVGTLASAAVKLYANPLGLPIGSQTYPHRQLIKDGNFA